MEELRGPGFYKRDKDDLLYGTMITGPGYFLLDLDRDNTDLPCDGWQWFENEQQARQAFGL